MTRNDVLWVLAALAAIAGSVASWALMRDGQSLLGWIVWAIAMSGFVLVQLFISDRP